MYDRINALKKKRIVDAGISPLGEISAQFYGSPIVISKRAHKRLFKKRSASGNQQVAWYNALWASIHRVIDYPIKSVGLFPVAIKGQWEVFKISYFSCDQGKANLVVSLETEKLNSIFGEPIKPARKYKERTIEMVTIDKVESPVAAYV